MEVSTARKYLERLGFALDHRKISFITRLFPHLSSAPEVSLICHMSPEELPERPRKTPTLPRDPDVTGSPLEHSFGDDSFHVSLSSAKRNWMRREEKYIPLDLRSACEMLGCTEEQLGDADLWTSPLFALADAGNEEGCVLVGSVPDVQGFMPHRANIEGVMPLSRAQKFVQAEGPLLKHNASEMNPSRKQRPQVQVSSIHEVCGGDPGVMEFSDEEKEDFEGHLRVETSWNELTFRPSVKRSSSSLVAAIVTGSRESCLQSLWGQLLLLNDFLGMLDEYQKKHMASRYSVAPLHFPKGFSNGFAEPTEEIMAKLDRLLSGNEGLEEDAADMAPGEDSTNDGDCRVKLEDLVGVLEGRQDQDFASGLWKILKGAESYTVLTDCVHSIFESASTSTFKPVGIPLEDTRLMNLLEVDAEKPGQQPQLAGSGSMELVVDLGMEKLTRDYAFLVSTANLMEAQDVRKMLNSVTKAEFDISKYRDNLLSLARVHVCLEFLQLIQSQLNCRMEVSRALFESALKSYGAPNSPFKMEDLGNSVICELVVPTPKGIISEVIKTPPASWMCTLTTNTKEQNYGSVIHYSRTPIFPPNIYTPEEDQVEDVEPMYHVTTGSVIKFKLS